MNITFNREMTLANMYGAARYTPREQQVFGCGTVDGQFQNNPYVAGERFTPIGLVLHWLGVDVEAIETTSERHVRLCRNPDCFICSEEGGGADTSIYARWVQNAIKDDADVTFTDDALDLLWSAEISGLTLRQWLAAGNPEEVPF